MRSFLLSSLAALAIQNAYAHPTHSGLSQSARMLSRRAIDLDAFRLKITTGMYPHSETTERITLSITQRYIGNVILVCTRSIANSSH